MKRWWTSLAILVALALPSRDADARVERFAVVVGANAGAHDEVTLRYAQRDAERVADVLVQIGGFPQENVVRLLGTDEAAVRHALVSVNDRVRAAVSGGAQVVLFVYYSGHADENAFHLSSTTLTIDEVTKLVRGSAASTRLLVIDACRSGAAIRRKGARPAPEFAIAIDAPLAAEGAVVMTASAANEDAQESDELGGSFFTHYLVSGLLGAADSDHDGDVDLSEAYRFAYDETLRATSRTIGGTQHPSFRYDLSGADALVLTTPGVKNARRAGLRLPDGRSYLVFRAGSSRAVVAEIGADNPNRRLSVDPGRYFIRGRGQDDVVEGELELAAGSETTLDLTGFTHSAYVRLVRKGLAPRRAIWGVTGGAAVRSDIYGGHAVCAGGELGLRVDLSAIAFAGRLGGCQSSYEQPPLTTRSRELLFEVRAMHAWDLGPIAVDLGVAAGAAVLRQDYVTLGVAPPRTALAGELAVVAGLEWPSDARVALAIDAAAGNALFRKRDQMIDPTTTETVFVLRGQVGAILRF
jgi:hypothetical protein